MCAQAPWRVGLICGHDPHEPPLSGGVARHDIRYINRRFWCPHPASLPQMAKAIEEADLVHVHSYWNGFASAMIGLAQRIGKPVVLSPRGVLQRKAMAQSSVRAKAAYSSLIGRRQLTRISGYHFQTQEEAEASYGVSDQPSIILDNGVNVPEFTVDRAALRTKLFGHFAADLNLVFLGRTARIKGIELQINALRLLHEHGVAARLHLVGPDGGDQGRLNAVAKQAGVADRVHMHGPVYSDTKQDWLRAADAVLMSSEFENNSNAALEAMAAGGALIGTEGTIPDDPVNLGAALRVVRQPEALAQRLRQPIPHTLRDKARHYVGQHHAWQPRAARMLTFYESLL